MTKTSILAATFALLAASAWAACTVKKVDDDKFTTGVGGGNGGSGNEGGSGNQGGTAGAGVGGGSPSCVEDCYAAHPAGATDYDALLSCTFCGTCYDICDGATTCDGGSELGCSASSADCDSCANSVCSVGYDSAGATCGQPADPNAVCVAEFEACFCNSASTDCSDLADCVVACP
jgi:hypothetical protein